MKLHSIVILFSITILGCSTTGSSNKPSTTLCGNIFEFRVSPTRELEYFKLEGISCAGGSTNQPPSAAWLKTACAHFSTISHEPTYKLGEDPKSYFINYYINLNRPDIVLPDVDSGSTTDNPYVIVLESILVNNNQDKSHVCDGNLIGDVDY